MMIIWWPAFLVPAMMLLAGLLGRWIPGFHYRSPRGTLEQERQTFADAQLRHMLWQFGLVFGTMAFMTMGSVRLLAPDVQKWLLYGAVVLEVAGVLLLPLPVERAIHAQFDEEKPENEGDLT